MKDMGLLRTILLTLFLSFTLSSCKSSQESVTSDQLRIVCTTGMITDVVSQVADGRAEVLGLMGAGIDPHLYKPTRSDIARLTSADIVFYNGLFLEGKFADAFLRLGRAGIPVHALTEMLDTSWLLSDEEDRSRSDPHLWMDPLAWKEVVKHARDAMIELDSEGAELYSKNADALIQKIRELHEYSEQVLSTIPENSRILITAHDAFQYFGRRYNIEVEAIQGLSTESEAGVLDIERLVSLLVSRQIPSVFIESTVSDRNIRALIEGARAQQHEVKIGGELFSDAFGPAGTYRGTYIGMIDHNVTTIARELGGEAPLSGFQGKL